MNLQAGSWPEAIKQALGEIETGARQPGPSAADRVRGRHQEVSRYQVLPAVWHQYTKSPDYSNPARAWSVAQRILDARAAQFRRRAGREPNPMDLYLMWNAPGQYERASFDSHRVRPVVRERAVRFAALVRAHAASELTGGVRANVSERRSEQRRAIPTERGGFSPQTQVALN
jgi:hypothetical protein